LDIGIRIDRSVGPGPVPFTKIFEGFDKLKAVQSVFGRETEKVLSELVVDVVQGRGYMRIDDKKGSLVVNSEYLSEGSETHIYLDVIHELVHIRQLGEGKELWDERYKYVDRPTEIEAYRLAVEEARNLGLTHEELIEYLRVEWISEEDFTRFLRTLEVRS